MSEGFSKRYVKFRAMVLNEMDDDSAMTDAEYNDLLFCIARQLLLHAGLPTHCMGATFTRAKDGKELPLVMAVARGKRAVLLRGLYDRGMTPTLKKHKPEGTEKQIAEFKREMDTMERLLARQEAYNLDAGDLEDVRALHYHMIGATSPALYAMRQDGMRSAHITTLAACAAAMYLRGCQVKAKQLGVEL